MSRHKEGEELRSVMKCQMKSGAKNSGSQPRNTRVPRKGVLVPPIFKLDWNIRPEYTSKLQVGLSPIVK